MPPLPDDVLSPELVLVDPGLRARARAGMVVPHVMREPRVVAEIEPEVIVPEQGPRLRVPSRVASVLVALVSASVLVLVVGLPLAGRGQLAEVASGDSGPVVAASDSTKRGPAQLAGSGEQVGSVATLDQSPVGTDAAPVRRALDSTAASSDAADGGAEPASSGTSLAWSSTGQALVYDVELVRGGKVIYATASTSADLAVPRSWTRAGVLYRLQPEDQLFVWPVTDGRRGEPVVDGRLAFELTPVARAIDQMRRSTTGSTH